MAIQTATTGNLASAQNIIVAECRFTGEHNDPCRNLVSSFTLGKGEKQITVPKVGQMTAEALTDGTAITSAADIGLTTVDLTCSEVGVRVVLTDKLTRQFNENIFRILGRQTGDAISRYVDKAIIALFPALNGGAVLGADNSSCGLQQVSGCVAWMMSAKAPRPYFFVHHPNAIANLCMNAAGVGTSYYAGIQSGFPEEKLRDFWKIQVSGVNCYQDGNIDKISTFDSGYGVVASREAMCYIESLAPTVERQRQAALRAWEIIHVTDYGVFELDDSYGAPAQYEIGTLLTA